mmetsp:Transcript_13932/g.38019  ORF Transcript_13932/g.38019 Transcript_13932/m.38019 type:complete len:207 (-) Transcript_13932:1530-2150(-)
MAGKICLKPSGVMRRLLLSTFAMASPRPVTLCLTFLCWRLDSSLTSASNISFKRTRSPRRDWRYRLHISDIWVVSVTAVSAASATLPYASMRIASSMFKRMRTITSVNVENQVKAFKRPIAFISSQSQSPIMARKEESIARYNVAKLRLSWPKKRQALTEKQKYTEKNTIVKCSKSFLASMKVSVTIASRCCAAKDLKSRNINTNG